jgi:hypothetical protein
MKFAVFAAATLLIAGSTFTGASAQPDSGANPGGQRGGAGMHGACKADLDKLCPGVQPGGGRVFQCLREHQDQVSDSCKSAMASVHSRRQQMSPATETPETKAPN